MTKQLKPWTIPGVALAVAITYMISSEYFEGRNRIEARGPIGKEVEELRREEIALSRIPNLHHCAFVNPSILLDTPRSPEWMLDAIDRQEDHDVIREHMAKFRLFLERRRAFVMTCNDALARGDWTREAQAEASRLYNEQRQRAQSRPAGG